MAAYACSIAAMHSDSNVVMLSWTAGGCVVMIGSQLPRLSSLCLTWRPAANTCCTSTIRFETDADKPWTWFHNMQSSVSSTQPMYGHSLIEVV